MCAHCPRTPRFNVELWDELAQQVEAHAHKGIRLAVSGRLAENKCAHLRYPSQLPRSDTHTAHVA